MSVDIEDNGAVVLLSSPTESETSSFAHAEGALVVSIADDGQAEATAEHQDLPSSTITPEEFESPSSSSDARRSNKASTPDAIANSVELAIVAEPKETEGDQVIDQKINGRPQDNSDNQGVQITKASASEDNTNDIKAGADVEEASSSAEGSQGVQSFLVETESDSKEVSVFILTLVRHSYSITCLHLLLGIVCAIFAIPYVDLSNPSAGLRLRDDPFANRADGFLAALNNLQPEGFGSGIVGASSVQTKFPERTQSADTMTLIWYTDPPENIFTEQYLRDIEDFESKLFNSQSYRTQLCKLQADGNCTLPRSPIKFLLHDSSQALPLSDRVQALFASSKFFFGADYTAGVHAGSSITRSQFFIGAPFAGFDSFSDRKSKQQDLAVKIMSKEVIPLLVGKAFDNTTNPRLTYNQRPLNNRQSIDILAHDLVLASIAAALIYVCVLVHTKSLFVATGAIIQILVSFPVSLFIYRMVFGIKLFGGMHVLAIFLILGIGVDDCFVFFDAFDQSTRENPTASQAKRMQIAYVGARYAMFSTSFTTALCFLSLITCSIPVLRFFGIFCGMLVVLNYILVMTLFAGILLIWDSKLRKSSLKKSKDQLPTPSASSSNNGGDMLGEIDLDVEKATVIHRHRLPVLKGSLESSNLPERIFVFLGERFITNKIGKVFIIISCLSVIFVLAGYASQLQPSKSIDSFWPNGHPFKAYEEYNAAGFYGEAGSKASIKFMSGLKAPFRDQFDYAVDDDFGHPIFDDEFDITSPYVQSFITEQCAKIRLELPVNPNLYSTNQWTCPLNQFQDWCLSKGRPFPVTNGTELAFSLLEFVYQPPYFSVLNSIGFKKSPELGTFIPRFIYNSFPTTRSQRADDLEQRTQVMQAWSAFAANGSIPGLGKDGSTYPVDGFYEVWMETQNVLLNSAYTSIAFSVGVALLILLIATYGDPYSAFVGVFCLTGSVAATLGVMYSAGWSLGAIEAVACTILCGVAVDYSIHMSIAHSETYFAVPIIASRNARAVEALRKLGPSVLFGALTTFLASAVLLLCTISVLFKFGQFMIMVVGFAAVFALFLEMALLTLPVPSRPLFVSKGPNEERRKLEFPDLFAGRLNVTPRTCYRVYLAILAALIVATVIVGLLNGKYLKPPKTASTSSLDTSPPLPRFNASSITFSDLPIGKWTEIIPPASPVVGCAKPGELYSFFVYRGDATAGVTPAVYFEFEGRANGICYSKDTCKAGGFSVGVDRPRFRRINAGKETFPFLLNQRPPEFEVYFPYCTADAFIGNKSVKYDGDFLVMNHFGIGNVRSGMEWVFAQMEVDNALFRNSNFVFQGCGSGGMGALSTSIWASGYLSDTFNISVNNISLIVDSAVKAFSAIPSVDSLAAMGWASEVSIDFATANSTLNGRMLAASSAYDWYQSLLGGFGRAWTLFRIHVENDPTVFPFIFRTNGDHHCVVTNPVQDRLYTDPVIEDIVKLFLGDSSSRLANVSPVDLESSLRYKCATNVTMDDNSTSVPCRLDADARALTSID